MKDPYDSIEGVSRRTGVASDYANAWMPLVQSCINAVDFSMTEGIEKYKPPFRISTYEEYITGRSFDASFNSEVFKASDPARVNEIDAAVGSMNEQLQQLLGARDYLSIIAFWEQRVEPLVR